MSALELQRCDACGHVQHPARTVCTACIADDPAVVEAGGGGVVDSFTVVHCAPEPGVEVPYVVARVLLDEGPIVLTRLVGQDPESWSCDDRVRLIWEAQPDGSDLAVFEREIS